MRDYIIDVIKEELSDYRCENMRVESYVIAEMNGQEHEQQEVEGSEYIELRYNLFTNEDYTVQDIYKALKDGIQFKHDMKLENDSIGSECTLYVCATNKEIVIDIY